MSLHEYTNNDSKRSVIGSLLLLLAIIWFAGCATRPAAVEPTVIYTVEAQDVLNKLEKILDETRTKAEAIGEEHDRIDRGFIPLTDETVGVWEDLTVRTNVACGTLDLELKLRKEFFSK